MDFDDEKINQAALALLYLTLHDYHRAWKGIDWEVMNNLHELGLIENPVNKTKSVVFTDEGLARAKAAARSLFESSPPPESGHFEYGTAKAKVSPAGGVKSTLCKTMLEDGYFLRVNNPDGSFTDYDLRHDDLEITISPDALASFYDMGDHYILDHSPQVLGLKRSRE